MPVVRQTFRQGVVEIPTGNRSAAVMNRAGTFAEPMPAQWPTHPGAGISGVPRPGIPATRRSALPARSEVENFLGVTNGRPAGHAVTNVPAPLSTSRSTAAVSPASSPLRPEQRSDWAARSLNRNPQWQQRVTARHDAWTNWEQKNQAQLNTFAQTRDQRWASLQTTRHDPQNWRDPNGRGWQQHRRDLWDFRMDRAREIRSRVRDFCDGFFDDRWWGRSPWCYGYGYYGFGSYPVNPWWWWTPAGWADVSGFVDGVPPNPAYADYGGNILYDGDTAYVDGQPVPAQQYTEPMTDLAVNAAQQPPPTPPAEGQTAEWLPLGVFALAQEEEGDPVLFLQLSVSRQGAISGAYTSALTEDQRPVTGVVDKATQRVVWRIGANTDTIYETSLANLTQDVSPVAIHFGNSHTQTWLLVRMPPPAPAGNAEAIPEVSLTSPAMPPPAGQSPDAPAQ